MNGTWDNPYDKKRSDINFTKNHYGRRQQDQHPTVFPRVSMYSRKDEHLYCTPCKLQCSENMEFVQHLQSKEHMDNVYRVKGSKSDNRVKKEFDPDHDSDSSSGSSSSSSDDRRRRKKKSKRSRSKKSKKSKRSKSKKKRRRRHSSSSSYDSDYVAQKEAKRDREKRKRRAERADAEKNKPAGLAAEVKIAILQAEARARDLAKNDEEAAAKMTNVFAKVQDRVKAEADKDAGIVKTEAGEIMSLAEHKKTRKNMDDDEDFPIFKVTQEDRDLMHDDEDSDEPKDVEIIPDIVEVKPRAKLSFIAPRIPVNRNPGFGVAPIDQPGADPSEVQTKSAGGIAITRLAAGTQAVVTPAAFSANNALAGTSYNDKAKELQEQIVSSMQGVSEIHATMAARQREHELTNIKTKEEKMAKNAVKVNILDNFEDFTFPLPEFANLGIEPIPCGMAMPGYAYDIGEDGNAVGDEIEGFDDFDMIDIKVY